MHRTNSIEKLHILNVDSKNLSRSECIRLVRLDKDSSAVMTNTVVDIMTRSWR